MTNFEDREKANEILQSHKTHYADALHAVIAQRSNVTFLVTKNLKDFMGLPGIDVRRPDDI